MFMLSWQSAPQLCVLHLYNSLFFSAPSLSFVFPPLLLPCSIPQTLTCSITFSSLLSLITASRAFPLLNWCILHYVCFSSAFAPRALRVIVHQVSFSPPAHHHLASKLTILFLLLYFFFFGFCSYYFFTSSIYVKL